MSEIKDKSVQVFLDELASRQATPGGGSAAALFGAQAAALVSMVCNLTLGKPKFQAVEAELQTLLQKSEALRTTLTDMIKADVDVFNALMACYGLPKATDDEKAFRAQKIQLILKEATLVPLACAKTCLETIQLSRIAAEKGNPAAISDAGVAALSGLAGLKSAALNVRINLGSIKDQEFVSIKQAELDQLLEGAEQAAEDVYQYVKNKL